MAPAPRLPRHERRAPTAHGTEGRGVEHVRWRDVVTVPNATSTLGLLLTLRGAAHLDSPRGLLQAAAGRALDVLDGALARRLGRTSPLGAALDASCDKVAVAALIAAAWARRLVPRPALVAIAAQNLLNGAATAGAEVRGAHRSLVTVPDGKLAMACQHLAMAAYALAAVARSDPQRAPVARALRAAGHVATAVGVGHFGARASAAYLRRAQLAR